MLEQAEHLQCMVFRAVEPEDAVDAAELARYRLPHHTPLCLAILCV
jgi:hypothetical protein